MQRTPETLVLEDTLPLEDTDARRRGCDGRAPVVARRRGNRGTRARNRRKRTVRSSTCEGLQITNVVGKRKSCTGVKHGLVEDVRGRRRRAAGQRRCGRGRATGQRADDRRRRAPNGAELGVGVTGTRQTGQRPELHELAGGRARVLGSRSRT
jgi:hypothetical protein